MALQILNRAQAFVPGSDLWVLPAGRPTPLLRKVDWYLNFQIARAHQHAKTEIAPHLKTILNDNSLPDFGSPSGDLPLLIPSSRHFPTKMVVEVPMQPAADWVQQVLQIWTQLDRPPLRVFLPEGMTPAEYERHWQGEKGANLLLVSA
jgi:hypothetical protein